MYFSLIEPAQDRERHAAREWTNSSYSEHQWLWKLFPAPHGTPRDFLFRRWDSAGMPRFYVLSQREPHVLRNAWRIRVREYTPKLEPGARLRFDLRANPVVTDTQNGICRRHDVVMQAKKKLLDERGLRRWQDWHGDDKPSLYSLVSQSCGAWLRKRASRLGFELDEELLSIDSYQRHAEDKGRLLFSTVDFSGELTVVDPVVFCATLQKGIGRAKAFGCGLMLVRRL